ncbi:Putative uncharacterized protein [Mycobacterium tuberculosis variant bovis]|nr:Putative uncharacterized protein [Mycobacterium tuberculosis variant bovis]CEJ33942.1 Putative uncharacterized protein [Mycobacterium tuberculosis variant bovis]
MSSSWRSRRGCQHDRGAVWPVLDDVARVVQGDRGDALRGEHVAVVGSRQALLDSCGDLGVEHHALLQRQVRHRQMPRERSFHAAPRRRVLVRHRPTDAGPVVELLLGRTALTSTLGRRAVHQIRGDARDAVDGFGHDISPRV